MDVAINAFMAEPAAVPVQRQPATDLLGRPAELQLGDDMAEQVRIGVELAQASTALGSALLGGKA